MGIHHGGGLRQRLAALMVVGDYQIQADVPGEIGFGHAGDAAVYCDDQRGSFGAQLFQRRGVEAVAVIQTVGDIIGHVRPGAAQGVGHQAGGGDTVHVVVAEHGDFFAPGHGGADARDGLVHVAHQKRVQRQAFAAVQQRLRFLRRVYAPGCKHSGNEIGIAGFHQGAHGALVRGVDMPLLKFHCRALLSGLYFLRCRPSGSDTKSIYYTTLLPRCHEQIRPNSMKKPPAPKGAGGNQLPKRRRRPGEIWGCGCSCSALGGQAAF